MKVSLTAKQIRLTLMCLKGELEGDFFDRGDRNILKRAEHNLLKAEKKNNRRQSREQPQ